MLFGSSNCRLTRGPYFLDKEVGWVCKQTTMGHSGLCPAFPWHHCWWGLKGLWTKSSLRLLFLPPFLPHTHRNTHAELLHRYDLTTTTFQVSPCCPPSPSKALTHCLLSTLSALTPHAATPLSGTHCLTLRGFHQGDELTAAAMRSAASWLQPSASHWFQQSVSILHPLQLAHAIIAGQRITGEAVDVSGWSQVWESSFTGLLTTATQESLKVLVFLNILFVCHIICGNLFGKWHECVE